MNKTQTSAARHVRTEGGPHPTVLIADGSESWRRDLAKAFVEAGFSVAEASTATEALRSYVQSNSDVVVTELDLTRLAVASIPLSGKKLMDQMRKLRPDQKIILHCESDLAKEEGWKCTGADAYVQKTQDRRQSIAAVVEKAQSFLRAKELM